MRGTEVRGLVAVIVVSAVIGVLFVNLSDAGDDAVATTATTAPPTTTTAPPTTTILDAEAALARLCLAAENLTAEVTEIDEAAGGEPPPGPVQQAAERFYALTRELPVEPVAVRAEFAGAYEYFREFNAIGEPNDYDVFAIAATGQAERYKALLDEEIDVVGLEATRAYIGFSCGVALPDDLAIREEFKRTNETPIRRSAPPTTAAQ